MAVCLHLNFEHGRCVRCGETKVDILAQPTHILAVQPIGTPQIVIPYHSEKEAIAAVQDALEKGHLWVKPKKEGERHLIVQGGPGTVFMILTKADADRAIAAARFSPGNGAQIPRG